MRFNDKKRGSKKLFQVFPDYPVRKPEKKKRTESQQYIVPWEMSQDDEKKLVF